MLRIHKQRGFTLIELIVVIALLAILSSIAVPKLGTSNYALINTARRLRDDIRGIRDTTMAEGEAMHILFEQNNYRILRGTKVVEKVILHKDFSLFNDFNENEVAFKLDGTPWLGGGTIKLMNNKRKKYCEVTVIPATGRVLLKNEVFSY